MTKPSSFADRLAAATSTFGHLCAGIDPSRELLFAWGLDDTPFGLAAFGDRCLDAFAGTVGVLKPQVAFFERHGSAGLKVLEGLLAEAHNRGFVVIADAKRGDLDSTAAAYAEAWLDEASPFRVDAVTMHAYLGLDALDPCFAAAMQSGRGIFVVVRSSNPEGRSLQRASISDGVSVETALIAGLARRNVFATGGVEGAIGPFGAVVGPNHEEAPLELASLLGPVLAPGLGAQGGTAEALAANVTSALHKVTTCNLSRAILGAGPDEASLRAAAKTWQDVLGRALG